MNKPRYIVGIDLGTSNSALAHCKIEEGPIQILDIDQVQRQGEIFASQTLPSALYLPHEKEIREEEVRLPWQSEGNIQEVVGQWALSRGILSSDRLVVSAKSWLINPFTDPREAVLPWGSEHGQKVSALQALTSYLKHLREALLYKLKQEGQDIGLSDLRVVITIPASFDEIARQHLVEAAREAGFENLSLLEEPQAAFYSYIAQNKTSWQKQVQAGDLVLVCDVGGGTSDFTLIAIHDQDGELALERIAVGDHLLLGGDNMDMAIAYVLQAEFAKEGTELDQWQFLSLVHEARRAKEELFSRKDLSEIPITVTKRGKKLIANTVTKHIKRETLESLILDGFFPLLGMNEALLTRTLGIQEWGLPYESDPAITKHLAAFLKRAYQTLKASPQLLQFVKVPEAQDFLRPTKILFNGGVFQASAFRERVIQILQSWSPEGALEVLHNTQLDLAVAEGAAYFARVKESGKGVRIKAGTTRSYYIGLEAARLAVPGFKASVRGLCIVPQGTEEGTQLAPNKSQFGLVTGEPAQFRFFHSKQRGSDTVGHIVADAEALLEETKALTVTLPSLASEKEMVPVTLEAGVSDVGTLQVFMKHVKTGQKWQVEFDLRKSESE